MKFREDRLKPLSYMHAQRGREFSTVQSAREGIRNDFISSNVYDVKIAAVLAGTANEI